MATLIREGAVRRRAKSPTVAAVREKEKEPKTLLPLAGGKRARSPAPTGDAVTGKKRPRRSEGSEEEEEGTHTSSSSSSKRCKVANEVDPLQLVRAHRDKLAAQTSETLRQELASVRIQLAECAGKRWCVLDAKRLAARVKALEAEISRVDGGAHVADFDRKVAPYLARFRRLASRRGAAFSVGSVGGGAGGGKAGRVLHVGSEVTGGGGSGGGGGGGGEGGSGPTVRFAPTGSAGDARQNLLDDMRVGVFGEAAPLYVSATNVCVCSATMLIISNYSLWGCPACGRTRKYDNMTAAAVNHGTELDYSSNTYHQKSRLVESLEYTQAKEYADPPPAIVTLVMEALWAARRTPLAAHAEAVALEMSKGGPIADVGDAVARLGASIPDVDALLRADSRAAKVRRTLREIARDAERWLPFAQPEAAALTGKARRDAVEKFQDRIRKFYERSPKIAAIIGGYLPLQMRPDQEEYIRRLFVASGGAYDRFRKPGHQNWPGGYSPFIRSILVLLGLDEFVPQYPLPTGAKNVRDNEAMRAVVHGEMDWEYVSSTLPLPPMDMPPAEAAKLHAALYEVLGDDGCVLSVPAKDGIRASTATAEEDDEGNGEGEEDGKGKAGKGKGTKKDREPAAKKRTKVAA